MEHTIIGVLTAGLMACGNARAEDILFGLG
ncbi:hypothetical protein SAMN05444398_102271 [Roseovarius pacificus]|uniref:Uncharacterized protein n=1 Tax=Roseovarius pacificus TaxID=337701 RepID=A0A1M7AC92_9RHOB|nr:hypothetical protein SAMN05444398_102271 [Roseovarius pacificus]